jgi:hypothetical protein
VIRLSNPEAAGLIRTLQDAYVLATGFEQLAREIDLPGSRVPTANDLEQALALLRQRLQDAQLIEAGAERHGKDG